MAHRHKISKEFNYNWYIVSTCLQKKVGLPIQKIPCGGLVKILKLWGEKAIAGIAKFWNFRVRWPCRMSTKISGHFMKQQNIILSKYNCSWPLAFKCQRCNVYWWSNQKLLHHYQHAKIIQTICSIHQIICELYLIFLESFDLKVLAHFWIFLLYNY